MTIFNQAAVLKNQCILDSFQVSASCTRAPSTCCNPQTGLQTRYWSSLIPNLTFQEDFVPSDRLAWCCSSQLHHHGITVHSSRKQWASVRPHWQRRLFKCNANLMPSLNLNKAHRMPKETPWPTRLLIVFDLVAQILTQGHIYITTSDWLGWVRANFRMGVKSVYQSKS